FSYEALNSEERLTTPMIKRGGEWKAVDWQTALEYVASGLSDVVAKHGANAVGTLVSPHSTLEELALAARFMRALGSDNIDFRLRQIDFRDAGKRAGIPWLGMPIADLNSLDRALVVGSFLRKDHPLLAQRLRQAAKKGAEISSLHSVDDDWLMRIAHRAIVPPSMLADPRRAYLLLHAEPEFDCANPVVARAALEKAELVVVMSPFKHGTAYADVLLPVAPFTETPGTFINCEGRVQSFHAVVYPRGETRPAWKVLRVLGTLLRLPGFDIDTSESVRDSALSDAGPLETRLSNAIRVEITPPVTTPAPRDRVADVPIYFADTLVRRAMSLQQTADARPPKARMHRSLLDKLGVAEGEQVKPKQGRGEAVLAASVDPAVPAGGIRVA